MIEVNEIIFRWHRGDSNSAIQRSLGVDRKTVRKYIRFALRQGIRREAALPPSHELAALIEPLRRATSQQMPTPAKERLIPYHAVLEGWAKDPAVSIKQMWRLLKEYHPELSIGYTSLREYVQAYFRPQAPAAVARIEVAPGQQAQVDFGYAGLMRDPKTGKQRKTWAFVMTLSYSRHRFVRFVFNQDARTWVDCHVRAFDFFGAVPKTVMLDNLKAGVIRADLYDPTLNRLYQECERHYGFAADPAKVRTPRHKGKVERQVPIVRGQLLAGREFASIDEANARALAWCRDEAGKTVHSTTKRQPLEAFMQDELPAMMPLPSVRFESATWQEACVPFDHHVHFGGAFYSVPTRFVGKPVSVRGTERLVQIFHEEQLVKTHVAVGRGQFATDPQDYPEAKRAYLLNTAEVCRQKLKAVGEAAAEVGEIALAPGTQSGLRKAQKLLRLAEKYGALALEGACRRGLHFDNIRITAIEAILEKGLALTPLEEPVDEPGPAAPGFVRPGSYFSHVQEAACPTI